MTKSTLFYFKPKLGFPEWETQSAVEWLLKNEGKKCYAELGREKGVRTLPQNSALHMGCDLLANALNESGLEMHIVLKEMLDVPWTGPVVKEVYKAILKAHTGKTSTTMMDKNEPGEVWDILLRNLGEKHGLEYVPFPSEETRNK